MPNLCNMRVLPYFRDDYWSTYRPSKGKAWPNPVRALWRLITKAKKPTLMIELDETWGNPFSGTPRLPYGRPLDEVRETVWKERIVEPPDGWKWFAYKHIHKHTEHRLGWTIPSGVAINHLCAESELVARMIIEPEKYEKKRESDIKKRESDIFRMYDPKAYNEYVFVGECDAPESHWPEDYPLEILNPGDFVDKSKIIDTSVRFYASKLLDMCSDDLKEEMHSTMRRANDAILAARENAQHQSTRQRAASRTTSCSVCGGEGCPTGCVSSNKPDMALPVDPDVFGL